MKHLRKPVRVAAQMPEFPILLHIEADNQQSGAFPRLATTVVEKNGNVFAAAPAEEPRLSVSPPRWRRALILVNDGGCPTGGGGRNLE